MIVKEVFDILKNNKLTIAFAESMTGGYAAYQLIKNPGASDIIGTSLICYNKESKERFLGITSEDINKYTIVSEEIALKMAHSVKRLAGSDIGVSVTGNAGPTAQEDTDNHMACIGIVYGLDEYVFKFEFYDQTRVEAIKRCVNFIYDKLSEILP